MVREREYNTKKERSFDQDIAQPYLKQELQNIINKGSIVNTGSKRKISIR